MAPQAFVVFFDELPGPGRFVAFVHHLVKRHVQGAGPRLEGLDVGYGVAVFDARDVTAKKAGGLLDITLAEILFIAQGFKSLADLHRKRLRQDGG